jgi:hypothetical protein
MKMVWAMPMGWGLLYALALRRRFLLAFLLKVCSTFSGVLVGLVPTWIVVGVGKFAICPVRGSRVLSVLLERLLQRNVLFFSVFSVSNKWGVASCGQHDVVQ